MASFSSEIIGRDVVDLEGAMFGVVTDLRLAPTTGILTHVLVQHTPEIDPERLPWSTRNGVVERKIFVHFQGSDQHFELRKIFQPSR